MSAARTVRQRIDFGGAVEPGIRYLEAEACFQRASARNKHSLALPYVITEACIHMAGVSMELSAEAETGTRNSPPEGRIAYSIDFWILEKRQQA